MAVVIFTPRFRSALAHAKSICVLTGAGISAESGIPTFRGPEGLWKTFRPEDLATPQAFARDPELVWEWYRYRRDIVTKAEPNAAHIALVDLEQKFPGFTLITQNVDDLHYRAGSRKIFELHGNIMKSRCIRCRSPFEGEITQGVPKCICGGLVRPGVVWFGENLPAGVFEQAVDATRRCHVFFSIGTSAAVYPAASLPGVAKRSGACVVEINPGPTEISSIMDAVFYGKAGEILPEVLRKGLP